MKFEQPTRRGEALIPDYALKSHAASLGLVFYEGKSFPEKYHGGAFVVQHGSWNKKKLLEYRIIYIPFENGKPSGPEKDFLPPKRTKSTVGR